MTNAEQYRNMMEHAEPPAYLQTDVLKRVAELRGEEAARAGEPSRLSQTPHAPRMPQGIPARTSPRKHPSVTRRPPVAAQHRPAPFLAKLGTGLAAACLVIGVALAVPVLSPPSQLGSFADSFGLALYADAAEPGQSVAIATGESGIKPFGGMGGASISGLSYLVNLTAVGEGIETVTYRIEGEDVRFETLTTKLADDGTVVGDRGFVAEEFTVDYTEQHEEGVYQTLQVNLMSPEDRAYFERMQELMDEAETANPDELAVIKAEQETLNAERNAHEQVGMDEPYDEAAENAKYLEAQITAANKIAQATLIVTATLSDGSSVTQRYRISPIDNFKQALSDNLAAQGQPEDDPRLTAPLFTITELD